MGDRFIELPGDVLKSRRFECGCEAALVGRNMMNLAGGPTWVHEVAPVFVPCYRHEGLAGTIREAVADGPPGDAFEILESAMGRVLERI